MYSRSEKSVPMLGFQEELQEVLLRRNNKAGLMSDSRYPHSPASRPDRRSVLRLKAIDEIISSERNYLEQLKLLIHNFIHPLKERYLIDDRSHTILFGQIELIYNLNNELFRELIQNVDNVAQAFLKIAPFLKLYAVYAFDFRGAVFLLQEITAKNPAFRKFVEETEMKADIQRKLNSLLIIPIQRLPRYKLLLEQVILYTSPSDGDFKALKESVKQIASIVSHIDSCVEEHELTLALINLQNSLLNRLPKIVKPSRKIIKEGELKKIARNGNQNKRYCVLMSDIFMYCKTLKERQVNTTVDNALECCCIFPLKKCKVYELFPESFKITCQGDGIILSSPDTQLIGSWTSAIRNAIDEHVSGRKTLRKESSKRKPTRKKNVKYFDNDYPHNAFAKICNAGAHLSKNISVCSEDRDPTTILSSCFPRKRKCTSSTHSDQIISTPFFTNNNKTQSLQISSYNNTSVRDDANSSFGIFENKALQFDNKSISASNAISNTFNNKQVNNPWPGGASTHEKENDFVLLPPRKRVKFDFVEADVKSKDQFINCNTKNSSNKNTLTDKIYNFFSRFF